MKQEQCESATEGTQEPLTMNLEPLTMNHKYSISLSVDIINVFPRNAKKFPFFFSNTQGQKRSQPPTLSPFS